MDEMAWTLMATSWIFCSFFEAVTITSSIASSDFKFWDWATPKPSVSAPRYDKANLFSLNISFNKALTGSTCFSNSGFKYIEGIILYSPV